MTKCAKPLRHLASSSTKSSRSTNQNAPFGRLALSLTKCLSGLAHFVIPCVPYHMILQLIERTDVLEAAILRLMPLIDRTAVLEVG